jgi:hypothetical protein
MGQGKELCFRRDSQTSCSIILNNVQWTGQGFEDLEVRPAQSAVSLVET